MATKKPRHTAAKPTLGNQLSLLLAVIVVSVLVAITYYYFEAIVNHSINYFWKSLLNTDSTRYLMVVACFCFGLIFFAVQHYLDRQSEKEKVEGLGNTPSPTITNLVKILGIGFLSLIAGASLGPEAILVPACIVIGGLVGQLAFKDNYEIAKILGVVGFVALLTAFFSSFIAGILGLLIVTKQVSIKLSLKLVVIGVIASLATNYMLSLLSSKSYVALPKADWRITAGGILTGLLLLAFGYLITYALSGTKSLCSLVYQRISAHWWLVWLVACSGLSLLYLLGGSLVEFTGNDSIVPMINRAASLGAVGLLWLVIIKLLAIGWSKTIGYRGGLIFPTIFVASTLVVITEHYIYHISFVVGLIAVIIGTILANRKLKILF